MADRRYDEREVAEILRAAAESQASGPEPGGAGLTLGDIQRLAGEVGIDATHVEAAVAARQKAAWEPPKRFTFWGAPTQIVREQTTDGIHDDASWEEVVDELRVLSGQPGTLGQTGETREWTGEIGLAAMHLAAKPQRDRTRTRVLLNQSVGISVAWILTFFAMFMTTAVLGSKMSKAGYPPLVVLGSILIAWVFLALTTNRGIASWHRKNVAKLDDFFGRIESIGSADSVRTRLLAEESAANADGVKVTVEQTS